MPKRIVGRMEAAKDVDSYIAASPREAQQRLRAVRDAIREAAPDAVESISYGMPFYSYRGKKGIAGRICYFCLLKSDVGFYLRPPVIEAHGDDVAEYARTRSALRFSLDEPMPVPLIKKLVRARMEMDGE